MTLIRLATPDDAAACAAIYRPYVSMPVTFENTAPTADEFAGRIRTFSRDYPFLILEQDGIVLGYAYAHRSKERIAYQWNAELSIYLRTDCCRNGYGRLLYSALMDLLRLQKVVNVYGVVAVPNSASEHLHRSLDFESAGILPHSGYKCGRWIDVQNFAKALLPVDCAPEPFLSLRQVAPAKITAVLDRYTQLLQRTGDAV